MTEAVTRASEGVAGDTSLRGLFERPGVVRIAGAHNPLGARLAERAGFDGVWSSGLEVSASQGVPDTDILTMSELLSVAGSLAAAVRVPVVADCDAGYGNAHNVMNMIRRYEAAGISAVSIEDKRFPKVNSFIPGRQELAPIGEFCGKLAAAKAAQRGSELMVIARIEALIAGWGMEEALRRGEAYAEAGADAVLIHAKGSSPEPILEFLGRWRLPVPVVVVPTTYHTITAAELGEAGAKMVIYANHGLRAGITAVSGAFEAILREGRTTGIEEHIAPLATVFDLQGMSVQKQHEKLYITPYGTTPRAFMVPGEQQQTGFDERTDVLVRQAAELRRSGVEQVSVYAADQPPARELQDVDVVSGIGTDAAAWVLSTPGNHPGSTLVLPGDVFLEAGPLRQLAANESDVAVLVDVSTRSAAARRPDAAGVSLSSSSRGGRRLTAGSSVVTGFGGDDVEAEFTGAAVFSARGFAALVGAAEKRRAEGSTATIVELLTDVLLGGLQVHAIEVASGWTELRTADDLRYVGEAMGGAEI
ncbi:MULTISPECIES: isocitrate lyase/phosphoenolpyruvate mutase family protein [unclassified Streptomyces]|uniref:isocitrate lyase/phosphoenolpyruvate mutase family protein n=1 Tax=unclassified Streptomyces TaxID=2593676 RepID=UPI0037BA2C40